jgi:hypothetical protein
MIAKFANLARNDCHVICISQKTLIFGYLIEKSVVERDCFGPLNMPMLAMPLRVDPWLGPRIQEEPQSGSFLKVKNFLKFRESYKHVKGTLQTLSIRSMKFET